MAGIRAHELLVISIQGTLRDKKQNLDDGRLVAIRHRITAIGMMSIKVSAAEDGGEAYTVGDWRAGGAETSTEAELITGFWRMFERQKPRLVTYNGRGYAMPLLRYRSMAHGLSAPLYHAGDKNYGHRWSPWLHYDVMDHLCEHGASPMPSLHDACDLLGLVKPDMAPDADVDVASARSIAVSHVGLTAHLYLSMALLAGTASRKEVDSAREAIVALTNTATPS